MQKIRMRSEKENFLLTKESVEPTEILFSGAHTLPVKNAISRRPRNDVIVVRRNDSMTNQHMFDLSAGTEKTRQIRFFINSNISAGIRGINMKPDHRRVPTISDIDIGTNGPYKGLWAFFLRRPKRYIHNYGKMPKYCASINRAKMPVTLVHSY
uniref:Uncharacterized protein n=1 Tax=Steinernema glaseri TaxID=37863 RepID=A0A1I8AGN1_9BILA